MKEYQTPRPQSPDAVSPALLRVASHLEARGVTVILADTLPPMPALEALKGAGKTYTLVGSDDRSLAVLAQGDAYAVASLAQNLPDGPGWQVREVGEAEAALVLRRIVLGGLRKGAGKARITLAALRHLGVGMAA